MARVIAAQRSRKLARRADEAALFRHRDKGGDEIEPVHLDRSARCNSELHYSIIISEPARMYRLLTVARIRRQERGERP